MQLHGRDLKRYINQLRHAKIQVERRIAQMGGKASVGESLPGVGIPNSSSVSSGGAQVLSLFDILKDGHALGFFMQYLQQHRAAINLTFWLACKHIEEEAERRDAVAITDLHTCLDLIRAGVADNTHVQVLYFI